MFQFTHPGRGATCWLWCCRLLWTCFNSRTPGGVRQSAGKRLDHNYRRFNSRTPGGVRLLSSEVSQAEKGFNSRTPGGVRPL